jgi:hypothetical protein
MNNIEERLKIFVGSSTEGKSVAEAIQSNLDRDFEITIWSQGIFGLSEGTLESLANRADDFDFAVLVITADDMTTSKKARSASPRDNVVFELGFFFGCMGKERVFMVYDRAKQPKLPSDVAGITHTSFEVHKNGNLQASLGAACTDIKKTALKMGPRPKLKYGFHFDINTHFKNIANLLERYILQFFILMHEKPGTTLLRRKSIYSNDIAFVYEMNDRSAGGGNLDVDIMCDKLADADVIKIDLKNNVSLTDRGRNFAAWLIEHHYKAKAFKCVLGGWGKIESDIEKFSMNWNPNAN